MLLATRLGLTLVLSLRITATEWAQAAAVPVNAAVLTIVPARGLVQGVG